MLTPSPSMLLSPVNKRRDLAEEEHDIALETNQLMIRSPPTSECLNRNKRVRFEPTWSLDSPCNHPLASVDLESILGMSGHSSQLLTQDKDEQAHSPVAEQNPVLAHVAYESHEPTSSYLARHHFDSLYRQPAFYYSHVYHNDINQYTLQPSYFSKPDHADWFFGQRDFLDHYDSPPLPLSPSPPTTTNNSSSSSKSTCSNKAAKSKHTCKKEKDELIDPYWGDLTDKEKTNNVAGDSKSITLKDMCRKGLIREQDVIVYKRNFSACKVVVSKSMTVVKACGLSGISIQLDDEIFEDFETPTALETKILDHHGQVTKDKRPNGNAFKSIRLIRGGKDMGRLFDIRKDSDNKSEDSNDYSSY